MAEPLIVALHVPKCAGTTLERHLARHLGHPGFWSAPKRTRRLPLELLGRKYSAGLPGPPGQVRAVSGHFIGRSIRDLFPGRALHLSVILRDPGALLLSWYNYRMMRYLAEGKRPYSFRTHLLALPPDPVSHVLLERWLETPLPRLTALPAARRIALLETALAGFDLVEDVSRADAVVASLSALLGIPGEADRENTSEGWAAASGWEPLRPDDLDHADRELLDRRTRLDRHLWRRFALREASVLDPATVAPLLRSELARPFHELRRRAIRRA